MPGIGVLLRRARELDFDFKLLILSGLKFYSFSYTQKPFFKKAEVKIGQGLNGPAFPIG